MTAQWIQLHLRHPKEKNYTDAPGYCFPTASKKRLLCKTDFTTHQGPADAFQGDPAAEPSGSSLSQQQQKLSGDKKNPYHIVWGEAKMSWKAAP